MPAGRRAKALRTILRAAQYDIDQLAAELAHIRSQEHEIQQKLMVLDERRERESYSASIEAQPFVMAFVEAIGKEQRHLLQGLCELEKISSDLELRIREKFLERERWKTMHKNAEALRSYDDQRNENQQMDEAAALYFEKSLRV